MLLFKKFNLLSRNLKFIHQSLKCFRRTCKKMGGAGPDRNFQKCEICTHEPSLFPRQTRHWCFEPERLWAKYSTASQWVQNYFSSHENPEFWDATVLKGENRIPKMSIPKSWIPNQFTGYFGIFT